ncbi:hypothetical protein OAO01_04790 [Oligoflexia bacterium]|nr:hypothetical protein [Oligoflexia bacterium]
MAGTGLKAINSRFLEGLGSLSGTSNKSRSQITQTLRGAGASSNINISKVMRDGARMFVNSVEGLNATASFVNLSRSTLLELRDVTDDLIDIAEKATKSSTSSNTRRKLQGEMERLGNRFGEIVRGAKNGSTEYLTGEGLADIFQQIGLDKDQSKSIAAVFEKFILAEDALASESIKSSSPTHVPVNAYGTGPQTVSDEYFTYANKTSGTAETISNAFVSSVNTVYQAEDTIVGNNPTLESAIFASEDSTLGALTPGTLTADVVGVGYSEVTGHSVIMSNDDFLGFNSDSANQLFLVDERGDVVHQFTNFASDATVTINSGDLSEGNHLAYTYTDATATTYLMHHSIGTLGTDPSGDTVTEVASDTDSGGGVYTNVKINREGTYLAYFNSTDATVEMTDVEGADLSSFAVSTAQALDFIDDLALAITTADDSVEIWESGGGSATATYSGGTINQTSIAINESSNSFAVHDLDQNEIKVVAWSGGSSFATDSHTIAINDGEVISQLSLTDDDDVGYVADDSGDLQLYRAKIEGVDAQYVSYQITDETDGGSTLSFGRIANDSNVFVVDDTSAYRGYNASYQSLVTESDGASTFSLTHRLDYAATVLSVNKSDGSALIETKADLLGFNSSNYSQLYLVDSAGNAIQQFTSNANADLVVESADINSANNIVAFEVRLTTNDWRQVALVGNFAGSYNQDPSTLYNPPSLVAFDYTGNGDFSNLRISDTGGYTAFRQTNTGTGYDKVRMMDNATFQFDTNLDSISDKNLMFDFSYDNTILTLQQDGAVQKLTAFAYGYNGQLDIIQGLNNVTSFAATEADVDNKVSVVLHDEDISSLQHWTFQDNVLTKAHEINYDNRFDSIGTLTIGDNDSYGALATLPDLTSTGDSDQEIYRVTEETQLVTKPGDLVTKKTRNYDGVFDSKRSVMDRPSAYQLLADLKELRKQIDTNVGALDDALKTLQQNIDLMRSAGNAFLKLSDQISSEANATEVAKKLQEMIRSDASTAALAQADNLTPLTVAALTMDGNIFSK